MNLAEKQREEIKKQIEEKDARIRTLEAQTQAQKREIAPILIKRRKYGELHALLMCSKYGRDLFAELLRTSRGLKRWWNKRRLELH